MLTLFTEMVVGEAIGELDKYGVTLPAIMLYLADNPILIFAIIFGIPAIWQFWIAVNKPDWFGTKIEKWQTPDSRPFLAGVKIHNLTGKDLENCFARIEEMHKFEDDTRLRGWVYRNDIDAPLYWYKDKVIIEGTITIRHGARAYIPLAQNIFERESKTTALWLISPKRNFHGFLEDKSFLRLSVSASVDGKSLDPLFVELVFQTDKGTPAISEINVKEKHTQTKSIAKKEKPLTKEGFLGILNKVIKTKKPDEKRSDKGTKGTSA